MKNEIKHERKNKARDMRSREEINNEVYPGHLTSDGEEWKREQAKLEVLLDIRELLIKLVVDTKHIKFMIPELKFKLE